MCVCMCVCTAVYNEARVVADPRAPACCTNNYQVIRHAYARLLCSSLFNVHCCVRAESRDAYAHVHANKHTHTKCVDSYSSYFSRPMRTTKCPFHASMSATHVWAVGALCRRMCKCVCVTGLSPDVNVCRPYNCSPKRNTLEYIKFDFMNIETPPLGYCTYQLGFSSYVCRHRWSLRP